jgi:hypothetical protein
LADSMVGNFTEVAATEAEATGKWDVMTNVDLPPRVLLGQSDSEVEDSSSCSPSSSRIRMFYNRANGTKKLQDKWGSLPAQKRQCTEDEHDDEDENDSQTSEFGLNNPANGGDNGCWRSGLL